jgi:hypothetical protein
MLDCPQCHRPQWELVEARFHLRVFRCTACGHEESSLVYPADEVPPDSETVALVVRWKKEKASVAELGALRASFETFREVSLRELQATVGRAPFVRIGEWPRRYAEGLAEEARARELTVDIVPVDPAEG